MKRLVLSVFSMAVAMVLVAAACGGTNSPVEGTEGGRCYPNDTCNVGLFCSASEICVKPFAEDVGDTAERVSDVVPPGEVSDLGAFEEYVADAQADTPSGELQDWHGSPDWGAEDVLPPDLELGEMDFVADEVYSLEISLPDVPPLDKSPKALVTIEGGEFNGYELQFTSAKSASFLTGKQELFITMAKGEYYLEVHLSGIEEGVVGAFASDEPGSVTAWIWFNDGTTDQGEIPWKYESLSYQMTLDQFEQPGGWVKGTFSGTLQDLTGGPSLLLSNGFFDVPRKE